MIKNQAKAKKVGEERKIVHFWSNFSGKRALKPDDLVIVHTHD